MTKDEVRFWKKVDTGGDGDACWEWQGCANKKGYGLFKSAGSAKLAHRVSWSFATGEVPVGMLVCHRCDNPRCVRPSHLFLGTAADNAADCVAKGRGVYPRGDASGARLHPDRIPRGERRPSAKFTNESVGLVRRLHALGFTLRELAKMYGLHPTTVGHVVRRETWVHVA